MLYKGKSPSIFSTMKKCIRVNWRRMNQFKVSMRQICSRASLEPVCLSVWTENLLTDWFSFILKPQTLYPISYSNSFTGRKFNFHSALVSVRPINYIYFEHIHEIVVERTRNCYFSFAFVAIENNGTWRHFISWYMSVCSLYSQLTENENI